MNADWLASHFSRRHLLSLKYGRISFSLSCENEFQQITVVESFAGGRHLAKAS
jgi:hypothetical protein